MSFRASRPPSIPVMVETNFHIRSRPITLGAHVWTHPNSTYARPDCPRTSVILDWRGPFHEDSCPTRVRPERAPWGDPLNRAAREPRFSRSRLPKRLERQRIVHHGRSKCMMEETRRIGTSNAMGEEMTDVTQRSDG